MREFLGIIGALAFIVFSVSIFVALPQPTVTAHVAKSFGEALWEFRALDVFLQVLIILAGTLGILSLVKERNR